MYMHCLRGLRAAFLAVLSIALFSTQVLAQAPAAARDPEATPYLASDETRPATTTFLGDTGIWYVPTAEVLARRTWSAGGDRRGTNYVQGKTNVADFTGTVGFGVSDRVEVFGGFLVDTRINRDHVPVFVNNARDGGIIARYPRVSQSWTGNNVGDLYLGSKLNLTSQYRRSPMALAVRGMVKLPTGDDASGSSTGKTDVMADVIASREFMRFVEAAAYAGFELRGEPSGFETPRGSYRWGTGMTFPSRSPLRFSAEANGDIPTTYRAKLTDRSLVGSDGSLPPFDSDVRNRTRGTGGVTYQTHAGFFAGTGLSWSAPRYWDWQFRIGYHGRTGNQNRAVASVAPAVEPAMSAPMPVAPPVAAAPVAVVAAAPPPPPPPPAAAAAVVAPPAAAPVTITFEDVYFAFDGYTPNAAAIVVLSGAADTLLKNPSLNIMIEGHTCFIGTEEYNIALGERRASAVRDYFVSRGIAASRMRTASYGEESPKHDNAQEETRRLNRRVALVVNLQ